MSVMPTFLFSSSRVQTLYLIEASSGSVTEAMEGDVRPPKRLRLMEGMENTNTSKSSFIS